MNFVQLAQILVQLGKNLPAVLTFVEAVQAAVAALLGAIGKTPVSAGFSLSPEEHQHVTSVTAVAMGHGSDSTTMGGRFDGSRVAKIMKFLEANPGLAKFVFSMFGINLPNVNG